MPKIGAIATSEHRENLQKGDKSLFFKDYLVENGVVWDGLDGARSPLAASVWVRDGRIEAVGRAADTGYRGERRLDAAGLYLIPGLIDAHVHLELDPKLSSASQNLKALAARLDTPPSFSMSD